MSKDGPTESRREKPPLDAGRIRRIGAGFSWIDRRFVREFAPSLSRDEILLYFFLAAVADRDGLSFYGDGTAAALLKVPVSAIDEARAGLVREDLVAYGRRLYQVLSLPVGRAAAARAEGPASVGQILRAIARKKGE